MSNLEKDKSCGTSCGCGPESTPYWQDVENKVLDKKFLSQEFSDDEFESFSVQKNRRSFLKIMGFSVAALPLTGCIKIPVKKALPYLTKQNDTIPGIANWYASTFDNIPVLVKTREGRPIKIEGNDKSMVTFGGANARAQASILSLYDDNRKKMPTVGTDSFEWDKFDEIVKRNLLKAKGSNNYIITSSTTSPSEIRLIQEYANEFGAKHIAYDSVSRSASAKANEITHGSFTLSEYDFEKANVVVSIGADFLGTWGNSVSHSKTYSKRRKTGHSDGMNKHYHFENTMSLTGSNADHRFTASHAEQKSILLALFSKVTGASHKVGDKYAAIVTKMAKELTSNKGKSLVVCGCNEVEMQVLVNKINSALDNYKSTVTVYTPTHR